MYFHVCLSITLEKFNRNGTICSSKQKKEKKKQLCPLSVLSTVVIPTRRLIYTFPRRLQNRLFCFFVLLQRGSMAVGKLILFLVCDFSSPLLYCQAQRSLYCQLLKNYASRSLVCSPLFALLLLNTTFASDSLGNQMETRLVRCKCNSRWIKYMLFALIPLCM